MKIRLHNSQRKLRVRTAPLKRLVAFFLQRAARLDPGLQGEITVVLLADSGMRRLNRRFLGRDEPTDVLSFRYEQPPGIPAAAAGECFVNAERAQHLGPRHGGVARELALYLAHACDHLTGADDTTRAQQRQMRRREQRWLRAATERQLLTEDIVRT